MSSEKNIEAFLDWDVDGIKHVVGHGPVLAKYQKRYPDVIFHGRLDGEEFVDAFDVADYFVFPSRTDTFGMVSVEALSRGLPVIAYSQEMGPNCVIGGTAVDTLALNVGRDTSVPESFRRMIVSRLQSGFRPQHSFEAFLKIEVVPESNEPAVSELKEG